MIRIAFIMLCHTEPKQINRLLKKLEEFQNADVYIHVDLNHPEIKEQIINRGRVYILPEDKSFHITWGGINIVKATLELIRAVRNFGKAYDYIWLLSGQDYPIVPTKEIERRLEENKGTNYIDVIFPGERQYNWYRKLYEVSYPAWINKENIAVKAFKRIYKIATGGYGHTFNILLKKKPFAGDLFVGRQWWTLNTAAAFWISDYCDEHPEILEYYRNTIIPDESFFQTLFMNSPFRKSRKASLAYSSLERNRRHPVTLREKDLEKIKSASFYCCFARKFDENSRALIRMINTGICERYD